MNIKKGDDQYFGTIPILESEPIDIPNAERCRANHELPPYKARLKSLEKRKKEIEERNRKETEKRNRERETAVLEKYKNKMRTESEYLELVKKLAEMEIIKDKYKEEYRRVYDEYTYAKEAFEFAREEYKKLCKALEEERELREKAEKERDQAKYDKEYYAKQLTEHMG